MELLLIVLAVVVVGGYFVWKDRQHETEGKHPLDGATKTPEPWPFPTSRPPEGDAKQADPMPVMPTLTSVLDVNKDGRVDIRDAVAVVTEAKAAAVSVADVNKDGRVDAQDAKVVVEETKKVVKKASKKAKDTVEETVAAVKKTRKAQSK